MKHISKRGLLISVVSLLCVVCIALGIYLLHYDRNRDLIYHPQMNYAFMQNQITKLVDPAEELNDEVLVSRDGFEGILSLSCTKSSAEEIQAYFAVTFWNPHDGTHYTFPDDSYEIYVRTAQYMPIVKAWGHGWMHYNGNLYETWNGKDAAKDVPNFRNFFRFTIRKNDVMYSISVYCNTDNAETALKEAIHYLNSYQYY